MPPPIATALLAFVASASATSSCDILLQDGVTDGLHDLCTRFCDARGPDSAVASTGLASATVPHSVEDAFSTIEAWRQVGSEANAQNLVAQYKALQTASDPDLPCLAQTDQGSCPCWTREQLATMVRDPEGSLHLCEFYNRYDIGQGQGWRYGYVTGTNSQGRTYSAESFVDTEYPYCVYDPVEAGPWVWNDYISFAEAELCLAQLKVHCELHG